LSLVIAYSVPMKVSGVGIDIIEIGRFTDVLQKKQDKFVENTFTEEERTYCFSHKDPAPHFAGTFAAKEAVRKASGAPFHTIEIRRIASGKPEVWLSGRRAKTALISISHNASTACAVAFHS
jgi:holo-[acyl-carrier protein] synthase